jgi:hypothetical protein
VELFPANEYGLLQVLVMGMLASALLQLRRPREMAQVLAIFAAALLAAWLLASREERAYAVPIGTAAFFAIAFGVLFRRRLLPRITALVLIDTTATFYYALYCVWRGQDGPPLPAFVVVIASGFAALVLAAAFLSVLRFRAVRVASYVVYLLLLVALVGVQFGLSDVQALAEGHRFPPALFAYAFVAGGAFLFVAFNSLQILLLVPSSRHAAQTVLFDAIFGRDDLAREQADLLADSFRPNPPTPRAMAIVGLHAALLGLNAWLRWLPAGLLINLSLVGLGSLQQRRDPGPTA